MTFKRKDDTLVTHVYREVVTEEGHGKNENSILKMRGDRGKKSVSSPFKPPGFITQMETSDGQVDQSRV